MLQPRSFAVSRSFAFIDPTVPDLDTLLTGLEPGIEAHVLGPHRDGIAQIAEILRGQTVEAIHIFSHGAPGTIFLGNEAIDARTLRERYAHLPGAGSGAVAGATSTMRVPSENAMPTCCKPGRRR